MQPSGSPKISVVMIVKNEEKVLARCLETVKDADEIIVCDTGSIDNTIEVAKRFTDKVYNDYTWEQSFAKARNHAKSKATGDWILSIDADEQLEVDFAKVRETIRIAEERGALAVNIKLVADNTETTGNIKEKLKKTEQWHWYPRIFKNVPAVWWEGAVHNHISVQGIDDTQDIEIVYGYSPAHTLDPDRSIRIMEKEVTERDDAVRETFYLGREYYYRNRFQDCVATLGKYVQKSDYMPEKADAFLIMSMAYFQMGQNEDAKDACLQAIKTNPDFKEAILFMATLSDQKHITHWKKMAEEADDSNVLFVRPPAKELFISPHDDDNVLFGSFICIRNKPTVLVVLDSYIQPKRGEVGCSAKERAKETAAANKILGCKVERIGLHDDMVTSEMLEKALLKYRDEYGVVYAPALQGGNPHHDMISKACDKVFGDKVTHYTTYTKKELWTRGVSEVVPTEKEAKLKEKALACYESQIRINKPHFDAVAGKSEWLGFWPGLYLGAGEHRMTGGWTYLDRYPFPGIDVVCDVTDGLPFPDNYFHRVFSQDFLEHIPPEKKIFLMNEIFRVLKPKGTMEHICPRAGSDNDFGSPSHLSHWSLQQFEHFDVDSYRYNKDRLYEGFKGGFKKISAENSEDGQTIHVKYIVVK